MCVVVDVLSFSTWVTIAVERGMQVFPFAWKDERAASYAARLGAVLAVGRLRATHEGAVPAPSLSPAGLMVCEPVPRLVLPSPNGSTISAALQATGATVLAGCLRNASAVGHHLARHVDDGRSVSVIAAGERWHHERELATKGFSADVDVAGALDTSDVVAVLDNDAFTKARPPLGDLVPVRR